MCGDMHTTIMYTYVMYLDEHAVAQPQPQEHPTLWPKHDIVQLLDDALVESNARMVIPAREWHVMWSAQARSGAACLQTLTGLFDRLAQHCVARYGAEGPPSSDACFMAQLLRIRDGSTGKPLPWDQIVTQVGIAIVAGHDTTGHTIAFSLYDTELKGGGG